MNDVVKTKAKMKIDEATSAHEEKARIAAQKAEARAKRDEALVKVFDNVIKKFNVYYISENMKYAFEEVDAAGNTRWSFHPAEGITKYIGALDSEDKKLFDAVLKEQNRIRLRAVNSFFPQPDYTLNLLSTSSWVMPEKGDYDPIFDVLMNSLSDGRQNVRDHIEKVLVYKYMHPECYKLPCVTISGPEGGAGKNEFIEQVLATVFGESQVAAVGSDQAFGQFNGIMIGKTVVFIDEAIVEKTDAEALKRKVGNKTVSINMKYGIQGNFDNTPWYWLGGNGTNGAVMLGGDVTDRRYSVITVKYSVMHWVAKHLGLDEIGVGQVLPDSHPCVRWYYEHQPMLSNREQVSHWLYSLIVKWGNQDVPPSALHDEDYKKVIESQKSVFDVTMEWVFDDPEFKYIEAAALYEVYKLKRSIENERSGLFGKIKFNEHVTVWMNKNKRDLIRVKKKIAVPAPDLTRGEFVTTSDVWCHPDTSGTLKRNNTSYYRINDRGNKELAERLERYVKDDGNASLIEIDG